MFASQSVMTLECRLVSQAVECGWADSHFQGGVGLSEALYGRDAQFTEPVDLFTPDVRDHADVVVGTPSRLAQFAEVAQSAMVAGAGVARLTFGYLPLKPGTDAAVVSTKVPVLERLPLTRSKHDVHVPGLKPLEASDLLGIEAQLQEKVRLGVTGQLGVCDLVAPIPEA